MSQQEVYRAPLRSRLDGVDPRLALSRALALGLCGVGGRLDPAPVELDQAVALTAEQHGERAAARLRRFADVPVGAQVWTREPDGGFRRGVLTGGWRYDDSAPAHEADLVHVRGCRWGPARDHDDVPDAVAETFRRGGRNFQRIRSLS